MKLFNVLQSPRKLLEIPAICGYACGYFGILETSWLEDPRNSKSKRP